MSSPIDNILKHYPKDYIYNSTIYDSKVNIREWIYKRFTNSNNDFIKEFNYKTQTGVEKFDKINNVLNNLDKVIELFKNDIIYIILQICREFIPNTPEDTIRQILQNNDFGLKLETIKTSAKYRLLRGENVTNIHRDIVINEIYLEFCLALYDIIKTL
jgi:hypothetical protein